MSIFGKSDLIKDLVTYSYLSREEVERVLDGLAKAIRVQTAEGRSVVLPGVGRFAQKTRAARVGRNPQTGATIDIPEATVLTFKPSKAAS